LWLFVFIVFSHYLCVVMLIKIEIQNYAIIEKLEIKFPEGLTIITGETGAGKSILLGALGLIMGNRADTKVLFDADKKCFVEATFDVSQYNLRNLFDEEGLEYHHEMIIRREIAPGGKSRAFVNDSPVTLDIVQSITEALIDIHQQFDTLDIQKPAFQLQMIDALAGNKALLEEYTSKYKVYKQTHRNLESLREKNRNANQEIEFLSFQMSEFQAVQLKSGEYDDLEATLHKLTSAEDIKKNHSLLGVVLEENENALISQLQDLINQYGSIKNLDESYKDIYDRMISVKEELSDISRTAERIADNTEYDEEAIQNISNRLSQINRLLKKHNVLSVEDLLNIEGDIRSKLEGYGDLTQEIEKLEFNLKTQETELKEIAAKLSLSRKKVTAGFESEVHDLLVSLSMSHAYIKVEMKPLSQLSATGLDDVNILFSPNKGSEFLPLKDTASGGEMSRLTLCIKSLVAGAITLPTLIFDEIDAGVSGDVAQRMAKILENLSKKHQIICITHSPQIAAKAQSHYWVYKAENDHRTITAMRQLSKEDRITEIAKMLSGNPPTQAAIANAKELIGI
jgi:DNA repair protein RecN (Recombination protein N)